MADIKNDLYPSLVKDYTAPAIMDSAHWALTDWSVGQPITEESMDNTEIGIAILMTRMAAIENELGGQYTDTAQLNSSRLDKIINELYYETGTSGTEIPNDMISRLDTIINHIWWASTTTGTSRIDAIETKNTEQDNKLAAISSELGGTAPDGTSTSYNGTTRLDDIETELGGTRSEGNGYTGSHIRTLIQEVYGSTSDQGTSRIDALEDAIGTSSSPSDNTLFNRVSTLENTVGSSSDVATKGTHKARLDTIESTLGLDSGGSSSENSLLDRVSTLETSSTDHEDRIDSLETEIGMDGQSGTSLNSRVATLETMKDDVVGWDGNTEYNKTMLEKIAEYENQIQNLYALIGSNTNVITMEYLFPTTLTSAELNMPVKKITVNPGEADQHYSFEPYYDREINYFGTNIWESSYFENAEGITSDIANGEYYGSPAAFKTAFNNYFTAKGPFTDGIKLSFDFNFSEPTYTLQLYFNYNDSLIIDRRAYNRPEAGYDRITFVSLENKDVYGISTLDYGLGNAGTIHIKNVQVQSLLDTAENIIEDVTPQTINPIDPWLIPLPEPIYGGKIDILNKKIIKTYDYIASYNGEEVGNNYQTSDENNQLVTGVEVVYELTTPIEYNIKIGNSPVRQGLNYIPNRKTIITSA